MCRCVALSVSLCVHVRVCFVGVCLYIIVFLFVDFSVFCACVFVCVLWRLGFCRWLCLRINVCVFVRDCVDFCMDVYFIL